jgi:3-deoxy-D-manno-octulosonate 8-phosphate phosphatase (KDO 8-P phosphatase)
LLNSPFYDKIFKMAKWRKGFHPSWIKSIKALVMDVDGVLTDGGIIYDSSGNEAKVFNAQDGLGISLAKKAGLLIIWITGRNSPIVERRAKELGVNFLIQGAKGKARALREACEKLKISPEEVAYIADDLNDYPAYILSGLKIAVGNASEEIKERADLLLTKEGGKGAVREAIEEILRKQGKYEEARRLFLEELEE